MCTSFSDMGNAKAERDIENHENGKTEVKTALKPFTIKAPEHLIESLDVISDLIGISRSALVVKLINQYLGHATYDYLSAYNSVFSHDKPEEHVVLEYLQDFLNRDDSQVSEKAKTFLKIAVGNVAFDI